MGLDVNSLNLLGFASNHGARFDRTLSIGRASICMPDEALAEFLQASGRADMLSNVAHLTESRYFEVILREVFGALDVKSVDVSAYEGASMIHDMNEPIGEHERFSVVLDFGCLEHVFNFPVAVDNVVRMCEDDGHILHYLPANNCCGHGFYQFSPELFFSLYSDERGFEGTRVFFVEWQDAPGVWYEIAAPRDVRARVNIVNDWEGYLLVMTRRTRKAISPLAESPQQSDYLDMWGEEHAPMWDERMGSSQGESASFEKAHTFRRLKSLVKQLLPFVGLEKLGWRTALRLAHRRRSVRRRRSDVERQRVADLIAKP